MPEKQDRIHQLASTESVAMTSGQQAQKLVEEAKNRFWLNPEEEKLIVNYARKDDDPSLASQLIQKLEQAVYNADPVAVTRARKKTREENYKYPDQSDRPSAMHQYGNKQGEM